MAAIDVDGEIAPDEHSGITGVFITDRGFRAMLAGFKLEIGDWRLKLQRATELLSMEQIQNKSLLAHAKAMEWRAQWGIPVGLGLGIAGTMIVIGVAVGIFLALPQQVRLQAVQ